MNQGVNNELLAYVDSILHNPEGNPEDHLCNAIGKIMSFIIDQEIKFYDDMIIIRIDEFKNMEAKSDKEIKMPSLPKRENTQYVRNFLKDSNAVYSVSKELNKTGSLGNNWEVIDESLESDPEGTKSLQEFMQKNASIYRVSKTLNDF